MTKKSWLAAILVSTAFASAHSAPIQFTQTFSNVSFDDFGIATGLGYGTQPLGDWIFSATVDSEAVDLRPDYLEIGMFNASDITLTQADLGLDHVGINNLHFLYFIPDRFGFDSNIDFGTVWTRSMTAPDHFLGANSLSEFLALVPTAPSTANDNGFGPQWGGFDLANGSRIYGYGYGGTSTITVSEPTSVPEPETLSLMFAVMGMSLLARRRRRAPRA